MRSTYPQNHLGISPLVECDACGLRFPSGHLSDNWSWLAICVPCEKELLKEMSPAWDNKEEK